jgi:hypothetical protein
MATCFVLVASPLVGPIGWQWVADELTARGRSVVVPDLAAPDAPPPVWRAHVHAIAREIPEGVDVVLVGHSGAGRLIPLVADLADPNATCIFVDAQLPTSGALPATTDDWFLTHVRSLAADGVLPPWSEWWGADIWNTLVPDPNRRALLAASLPRVTLASVEEEPPPPTRWTGPGAYLRFSELFREHADTAHERGWVVDEIPGEHLHMTVDAPAVATKLVALADRAGETYGSQP